MNNLRIGVIGCGYWGPNLIRNFYELSSADLVAVADLKADRRAYMKSRYPMTQVAEDYRDFFSMPLDAVVVATPPDTHHRIALDCLQHDLHLLIEKPITLNSRDAEALIEEAEKRGLTLMVGHTFEYNPAVKALREIVRRGELGQIYYIEAERLSLGLYQAELNVLWDLAPHDISILLYILDRDPISVSAQGAASIFEGKHDIAHMCLVFPDDILAHVHVSWLHPRKVRRITVVGSRKMVVYDDLEPLEKIKIYDKGVEAPPYTDTFGEFRCSYRYGDVVIPSIDFAEPLRLECQHFLECIANDTEPQSSGWIGLKVVKILEAADSSLRNCAVMGISLKEERASEIIEA
jgi:predicted dehydrogenase